MSQSPQIGSMFLTECSACRKKMETELLQVAIPSNRVNVSYEERRKRIKKKGGDMSQSPQIGSMFLTNKKWQGYLSMVR